jgi:hypothetical protein
MEKKSAYEKSAERKINRNTDGHAKVNDECWFVREEYVEEAANDFERHNVVRHERHHP